MDAKLARAYDLILDVTPPKERFKAKFLFNVGDTYYFGFGKKIVGINLNLYGKE